MGFKDTLPDWVHNHLADYLEDGEKGHYWDSTALGGHAKTQTLLLRTIGRKTGKESVVPLPYGTDGENFVVIGSRGGTPDHPGWYYNLVERPEVDVQVVNRRFRALARTAVGEERTRLWDMMAQVYPPYPSYQKLCTRIIPVVVLQPVKA